MVESEAQGRLPGIAPVGVIDIGSNSVRLVVYEGLSRAPTVLFNEKVLCGLGAGLATTGRMDEEGIECAIAALRRFRALAQQARAANLYVLATAAAREAENGPEFVRRAEDVLGCSITILTGAEEAHYSALGIISGFHDPNGIAGDLGGGSLELIDISGQEVSTGITLPLGGLRLLDTSDGSVSKAQSIARKQLKKATLLEAGEGRRFYAVGGTWRNLAKLHMHQNAYPLEMMQAYEIPYDEAVEFLTSALKYKDSRAEHLKSISKVRRNLLPFGAAALLETITAMKPSMVTFSAGGVREGYLYSLLDEKEKSLDPLLSAAKELSILRARSPEHAKELAAWTTGAFEAFGVQESVAEARYRRAACLLADISWRAHPDYRGLQALNIIANGTFSAISHAGRAYIALANYYRFEGLSDDGATDALAGIATPRYADFAKLLGGVMRVAYLFSASMPGILPRLEFEKMADDPNYDIVLNVPADLSNFVGGRVNGRLQQLAKQTNKKLGFRLIET